MANRENSPKIVPPVDVDSHAGAGRGAVNPMALGVGQLAKMLAVPEEKIREHVATGAPADRNGRINLVHYAAWLNQASLRYALASQDTESDLSRRSQEAKPDGG